MDMKKFFFKTIIAVAVLSLVPQLSAAQGRVYMYDRDGYHGRGGYGTYHRASNGGTYYGFRVGVNAARVNSDATYFESNSSRAGLNAGFVIGQQIVPHAPVLFETGLMYSEKGGKSDYGGDFTYNLNYLEVPMVFKYAIIMPNAPGVSIQPLAGAYLGLGVGGYIKDFQAREAYHSFGSSDSQFKRFDAGMKLGCGLGVQMFYAEVSYNLGLANIGHDMFDETHNRGLTFTIGLNF